ncbi:MAG: cytochrome B5 [ANME-2 cluster archaeon]|nr:cytochrome B5 [ANME-2 cluster archaeon]
MRIINTLELSGNNGRDSPVYVAHNGTVYDVSRSSLWKGGRHQAVHEAGVDLSEHMSGAPHGIDMLKRFPVVGILSGDKE